MKKDGRWGTEDWFSISFRLPPPSSIIPLMSFNATYAHTNIIARDWRKLADFYIHIFGCVFVPPERDISGEKLEAGTGILEGHLRGAHLRLPGFGDGGPTLEIYTYNILADEGVKAVNRPGFGHIAFGVDDVAAASEAVFAAGGKPIGQMVTTQIATGAKVTWRYVTDPEGNIIELQSWSR